MKPPDAEAFRIDGVGSLLRGIEECDALIRAIHLDPVTGDLVIENGRARIVLRRDGLVRIEGIRFVASFDESLGLHAATIDLN